MSKTILVIDDEPEMIAWYQAVLSDLAQIRVATSVAQARQQLDGIDLIVLDFHLENEATSFQELVPELKQHAPVLLCSGIMIPRVPALGLELGVAGYWNKLENKDVLRDMVSQVLAA